MDATMPLLPFLRFLVKSSAAALFALAGSATLLGAQPKGAPGPVGGNVSGGGFFQSRSDLKDSPGSFSVSRGFIRFGGDYRWDFRNAIGISFGAGVTEYDFNNATGLSGGDPWERIEEYRISLPARFTIGETGQGVFIPSIRWQAESDADLADGQSYGAIAGVAWRLNDGLTLGPGLGVMSRLSGGARVFPILIIDWAMTDRLSLTTGRGLAASQGPGLGLTYQLDQDWSLGLAARYEEMEFRLDDQGVAPGGIGRDRVIPVVISAEWAPNPGMRLSGFAGVELGGTLSLRDEDERLLEQSDYDPAPIIGGSFTFRF
ncbi:MAG: hypothetical protein OIF40_01000 [Mangrovicoccus sp.]|nr:hypothetical protein [Mangrovicoccus sp.]